MKRNSITLTAVALLSSVVVIGCGAGAAIDDTDPLPGFADGGADTGRSIDGAAAPSRDAAHPDARETGAGLPDAASESDGGDVYEPESATAFLVNPAHTGAIDDPTLTLPLARRWNRDLGDATSYPLIVHGMVYVIVGSRSPAAGLTALDATTGATVWGPIDLGAATSGPGGASLAYDGGRIFTLNGSGLMEAFDARTGAPIWTSQMPGQYAFSSPLTAYRGMVYTGGAGSGGTAYGVLAVDGKVVWTADVQNGDESSPAVSDDGVFVSYACVQAYAFDRLSGTRRWWHDGPCEGGGGATPVLFGGRLYARDTAEGNLVLDAKTGAPVGTFTSDVAPAFQGHLGFFVSAGGVHASDVVTRASAWTFAGDGQIATSPVVAAGHVFVGSRTSTLYAIDEATGRQAWSDDLSDTVASGGAGSMGVMAAAEGVLVVPTGTRLVAYAHSEGTGAGDGDAGAADASPRDASPR